MKLKLRSTIAFILASYSVSVPGFAYEFENAVPLTLGIQLGETTIQDIKVSLKGHDVELNVTLNNGTEQSQYAGFYATTPLFEYLGDGEEHAVKTFGELKALQDGKPLRVLNFQRGYFLGQEITSLLRKAGVDPIPSNNGDWKKKAKLPLIQNVRIKDWQGQASFGWSTRISANSTALESIRYTALPQFSLETLDSDSFAQLVQQHCGTVDKLTDLIHHTAPEETQVLAEVFEFPLPFLKLQDMRVAIEKPAEKLPGGRRLATLACGYDGSLTVPSEGTIRAANNSISIMVVSLLSGAIEEENIKR